MTANSNTSTLKLRMAATAEDPIYIYLNSGDGRIYIKKTDSGIAEPLSSSRVTVSSVDFTKWDNGTGHGSVNIAFTVAFNTNVPQQKFSQAITSAIARVSAATFDSNVIPGTTNTYKIGVSTSTWQSINDLLYFSGSNVGIGVASPARELEVNGGLRLNTVTAKPSCVSGVRGTFWVTESGGGTKDSVEVCVKNASDTYAWFTIY